MKLAQSVWKSHLRQASVGFLLAVTVLLGSAVASATELPEQVRSRAVILEEIQNAWEDTRSAMRSENDALVSQKIGDLERLRANAGFQSLAEYSTELLAVGEERYMTGDREAAIFYLHMAERLSPESPRVAFKSLRLLQVTEGLGAVLSRASGAAFAALRHPELMMQFGKAVVYPMLWAATLGLYISFILLFLFHMPDMLRTMAHKLPAAFRGFGAPVATFVTLLTPCFLGPIVCIAIWAVLALLLLPNRRWMSFIAGVTIVLWGIAIPLRENIGRWLSEDGVQTLLRVTSGEFSTRDAEKLGVFAQSREEDGVAWYVYAQVLKQSGQFAEADYAFEQAEEYLGNQGWTVAERGTLAFLRGDSLQALDLFARAEQEGLRTAGFYFNYSKATFDRMDTAASRKYLSSAREKNQALVKRLQAVEELEGLRSQRAVADIALPVRVILRSALRPYPTLQKRIDAVSSALLPGASPTGLVALGGVLILLSLVIQAKDRKRFSTYYHSYEHSFVLYACMALLPGGLWIRAGKPGWTFLAISCCMLLVLPLLGWPPEIRPLIDLVPGFVALYGSSILLFILLIAYVAYHTSEEEKC